ncbi:MAG: aminotransferase class V-fold PLP-dependent enzyme [Candidatus Omnitrophica bacterium]|nr:aminotransferase class V-fold PLP-dependent enzyme [Candidatus Omnitrophota bacterium]
MKSFYCDYNATTPLAEEVFHAMEPYLKNHFGNPSSLHHLGRGPAKALREARSQLAALIGASDEREVIFTSCGSESNNAAVFAALAAAPNKKRIITSAVEHSSIRKLFKHLGKQGYEVFEIGVSAQGFLLMDELKRALNAETAVVSLMLGNNETGVLFPVDEIGTAVKSAGAFFHVDAVQAVGKQKLCVKNSPIDFLSASAHKLYGPKGVGALYVKSGTPFQSYLIGGGQERGRRAGTENVAGIVGFGAACRLALSDLDDEILRLRKLRQVFETAVCGQNRGVTVNGDLNRRLPTSSNLRFAGIDGEALMMALDQKGVCASSGSACLSGSPEPSHVLKAMGLTDEEANSSLRFSFGRFFSEQDALDVAGIIRETLEYFRSLERGAAAGYSGKVEA